MSGKFTTNIKNIAFFSAKTYDMTYFNICNANLKNKFNITYFPEELNAANTSLADNHDAVCAFVNDKLDSNILTKLKQKNVQAIALRCAGYNNVHLKTANSLHLPVVRVPAYSPNAVAEHAFSLLLTLNRRTHKAYNRVREGNFNLNGLVGFDLYQKTVSIFGTGKIGVTFAKIAKGFGMKLLAYDVMENKEFLDLGGMYVTKETAFKEADVVALFLPLNAQTRYIIDKKTLALMKPDAFLVNTGRGGLVNTKDLVDVLHRKEIGGVALDVYEQEENIFFHDLSEEGISDDLLAILIANPHVLVTSHQAFLTREALTSIANTTLNNLIELNVNGHCSNEISFKLQVPNIFIMHFFDVYRYQCKTCLNLLFFVN